MVGSICCRRDSRGEAGHSGAAALHEMRRHGDLLPLLMQGAVALSGSAASPVWKEGDGGLGVTCRFCVGPGIVK
ncbi:Hypothetical predicted protein [Olea europaea subsp. europaea]|uniref:Uncharacterized protein n=1 Tax=Olea europaea subsp. europaea TaxID=158383 RepID=A0A8S0V754_OLEEU|nr:Hypothetical predicted protein [Olea europaea subsp. europaea]